VKIKLCNAFQVISTSLIVNINLLFTWTDYVKMKWNYILT